MAGIRLSSNRSRLLAAATALTASLVMVAGEALAQVPAEPTPTEELNQLRPLNQSSSALSIAAADALLSQAQQAMSQGNRQQAKEKLQQARSMFNQLSGNYQELSSLFTGIDTRLYESNRAKALETAQKRDQATFELAVLHRAEQAPEQAIPLFMEVLRSQQPTRPLGQRAYQQLYELGFVSQPFSLGNNEAEPAETTADETASVSETGDLSLAAAAQMLDESSSAIAAQNYPQAIETLQQARETLNQISTFYQDLAAMFVGINDDLNASLRDQALEAVRQRDQATYRLALIYRTQNQPAQAVPLLMSILRSQQPTRELGQQAYQQLYELGFVEEPFSRSSASVSGSR
ncbi:uncharacterized protein XM38_025740 [Halomicronema hongdechloris C2206]|uniref:Uncharacterized protein n=1 Tax=Halomicronema hongdechloris C2206 TaxID=1641165 RepID=A0A1Z3HMV7_9CYAN|nr:hypothetical protein [Halomicronema hongdechloris]ASC71621.1 uncharacterized protein XM38_025740 [Halomicronema hongdechloris C2206]